MTCMLETAIFFQLALIIASACWIYFSKRRGAIDTFVKASTVFLLLAGLWLGGIWIYPPYWVLAIFSILLCGFIFHHMKKAKLVGTSEKGVRSNLPVLFLLPLGGLLFWQGFSGRMTPSSAIVDLSSPFNPDQKACVISGGISPLLNLHIFPSDQPRDRAQIYALDIIRLNPAGFRTTLNQSARYQPSEAADYAMFDTQVFAPCAGVVVEQENMRPDYAIGGSDNVNTGGNGVVLQCGTHHVHLHHLKKGSVLVELGDEVAHGQALGRVGNSGNTREPHLHLHAETIEEIGNPRSHGKPVHMRFDGRFMARGNCF